MSYLFIFFTLFTLAILVTGVVVMVKGGKVSAKYSNKLMIARVAMQAITITIIMAVIIFSHKMGN